MQNRLRSKVLWTSIISLGLFVAKTYFDIEIEQADKLVDLLLLTLSAMGIFNNPQNKESW